MDAAGKDGDHPSERVPKRDLAVEPESTSESPHQALKNPRSIRLVQLQIITPKPGFTMGDGYTSGDVDIITTDEQLAAADQVFLQPHLETFEFDTCPPYFALSYTWGEPIRWDLDGAENPFPTPRRVKWNFGKGYFDIPLNLRKAIGQLTGAELYRGKWFWMDAVCIDQKNAKEKATQVAMMGEIFSRADAVVVWLGDDTTDLDNFVWMHTTFLKAAIGFGNTYGSDVLRKQHPYDQGFLIKLGVTPPCCHWNVAWGRYFEFCRRRAWFFSRVVCSGSCTGEESVRRVRR